MYINVFSLIFDEFLDMPKAKKRKAPITNNVIVDPSSSKPQASRTLIRRFHVLLKKKAQLEHQLSNGDEVKLALTEVENEIEELGGLEAYQRMSSIGQGNDRGGGSEKYLISWLKEMKVHETCQRHRLLEVGALKPDNYRSCTSWIDATPMDLKSRHPDIIEQDFLALDQCSHRGKWGTISLSLVLNFVPEASDRGRMLRYAHNMLNEGGYLFLALPLPCVENSRYLTFEHLRLLMSSIGFNELKSRWKHGGKMVYYLYEKTSPVRTETDFSKKQILRSGNRNNFVILIRD
ncbi:hypothetical protein PC9H_001304 [Pleurotus ostreatus]|uniref:25S rRNA adenine-N(1) methyltransferase n=1 Tax=Pleurotus ostreatus TaxID=5322 RepID=A0A8H7AA70_PLEOS|nr:uncharacterized protein PC9H_001304 [Pleurotus ostreatus]KAF7440955.1 hypothetical protein PC9H_001304 [Pleurotus ostreatus]